MDVGPGKRFVVCVRYNARDDHGHYEGAKIGAATYVSGKLDRFIAPGPQTKAMCKHAALAPFPELAKLARRAAKADVARSKRNRAWPENRSHDHHRAGAAAAIPKLKAESKRGRRGHLTWRFSADDFPRFSTSSY